MLVLARRLHEKIILPSLDITIQVVGLQGNLVRLGIEAPQDVAIFREEVYDPSRAPPPADTGQAPALQSHNVRNRLNNLGQSLALLQGQLAPNLTPEAMQTMEQLNAHFAALKTQVHSLQEKPAVGRETQLTA
jgi:carbon storage regulator